MDSKRVTFYYELANPISPEENERLNLALLRGDHPFKPWQRRCVADQQPDLMVCKPCGQDIPREEYIGKYFTSPCNAGTKEERGRIEVDTAAQALDMATRRSEESELKWFSLGPSPKGTIGELYLIIDLLKKGYVVSKGISVQFVDVVATNEDTLVSYTFDAKTGSMKKVRADYCAYVTHEGEVTYQRQHENVPEQPKDLLDE